MFKRAREKFSEWYNRFSTWLKSRFNLSDKQLRIVVTLLFGVVITLGVLSFLKPREAKEVIGTVFEKTTEIVSDTKSVIKTMGQKITGESRGLTPTSTGTVAGPESISRTATATEPESITPTIASTPPTIPVSSIVLPRPTRPTSELSPPKTQTAVAMSAPVTATNQPTDPLVKLFNIIIIGETTYQDIEQWVNSGEYRCRQFWIQSGPHYLKIGPPNGTITMDLIVYSISYSERLFNRSALPRAEIRLRLESPDCRRDIVVVKRAQYREYDKDEWHNICLEKK